MIKIVGLGLALAISLAFGLSAKKTTTPNVVLIFMDDLGYGDLSCYGALEYKTPNLDQLANEGIRFTNFMTAQAVCSASRAALLTGCYPNRLGFAGALFPNSKVGLNADETTLAEMFKQKKYTTGIFRKWHLGDQHAFLPLQHGFDEYYGIPYSNDMWPVWFDGKPALPEQTPSRFPPMYLVEGNEKKELINTLDQQGQLTRKLTERAVRFMTKNKDQPFFLYLPHHMPHIPINASADFKGKSKQGLYGDVMMEMDWSVGQIIKTLKELKLDKKTLVIFASDNGPWLNFGNHAGSTGGLREGKGVAYEGGMRVPCIINWKGSIPEGIVCNQLVSTIDLLPTLAAICKLDLPKLPIDGINVLPLLEGKTDQQPRKYFYYYYFENDLQAVRRDNWKLVLAHPGHSYSNQLAGQDGFPGTRLNGHPYPQGLYNLRSDPGEDYDVQKLFPEIVKELQEVAEIAREDLGDNLTKQAGKNRRMIGRIQ